MTNPEPAVARDWETFTYDAFISYSHAADGKLAPALHNALQRFAKPWYRRRALHLFRDQTSLSATPGLWPSIEQALSSSRYFLLLASPEAAGSRWVQQEVAWWLEHQSPQTMLIGLTDGKIVRHPGAKDFDWEATDALPPNLKGVFVENPLWVDFRWAEDGAALSPKNPQFQSALAALAAPLRNIDKEDLIGEDIRQHRRTKQWAWGVGILLAVLLILAGWQWREAETQRTEAVAQRDEAQRQAKIALTRALAAQAERQHESDNDERGALLARQAYLFSEESGDPIRDQVDAALRSVVGSAYFAHILRGHEDQVTSLSFSPDGRRLVSTGLYDGTILLWDLGQPVAAPVAITLNGPTRLSGPAEFSPDGRTLAAADQGGTVWLWDPAQPDAAPTALGEQMFPSIDDLAFSPDGRVLAAVTYDAIFLLDPARPDAVPAVLTDEARSVAFSPDGQSLATAGEDGAVRLWHLSRPDADPDVLSGHDDIALTVAFSPDGRMLASGSRDGKVRLWDPVDLDAAPVVLEGQQAGVQSVSFAPDGRTLASGSQDGTVRLWDPARPGARPAVLRADEVSITSVAFSPDGRMLATNGLISIRMWIATTEGLADIVCQQVWRNLTLEEWRQFVGDPEQVPYQPTCPNLPPGEGVATAMATPV